MEPITTELRELAQDMNWTEIIDHIHARGLLDGDWLDSWHKAFDARCDAIDAVHARLEQENEELHKYSIWAPESHYMLLPKDADGEYIHIGDVVDVMPTDKFTGHKNVVVTSVIFKRSVVLVTVDTDDRPLTFRPNRIRRHHTPTVEDVLREFTHAILNQKACYREQNIAEYATKLRLAGDAE